MSSAVRSKNASRPGFDLSDYLTAWTDAVNRGLDRFLPARSGRAGGGPRGRRQEAHGGAVTVYSRAKDVGAVVLLGAAGRHERELQRGAAYGADGIRLQRGAGVPDH